MPGAQKQRESRPRVDPLTRRTVVEAALAIGDREGLEAISLRRLARDLGVTPMALYRYVRDKEDLLTAVAERVFEEFELPAKHDDWREELRAIARSFRRVLVAHPTVATLYSAHPAVIITLNGWRAIESVLDVLRRAGFSPREAALLENECERFVLALVTLETGGGPVPCAEKRDLHNLAAQEQMLRLPDEDFPRVKEAFPFISEHPDPDWAFEIALDVIVSGLEHLLEGTPSHLDQS